MIDKSSKALFFDICWFTSLFILLVLPFVFPKTNQYPLDFLAVTCLIGVGMIFSNRIRGFSIVGRVLYWIAINIFKPRTRYNHVIWGVFILGIGVLSTILGDKPDKSEIEFYQRVHGSSEFWIAVIAFLIFNILVGIYTARKHKKDKT